MKREQKWLVSLAIAGVVAGALTFMMTRHSEPAPAATPVQAEAVAAAIPIEQQVERAIRDARIDIKSLEVLSAGEIVILRGRGDAAVAEKAATVARDLGVVRVANLITPPQPFDDDEIRREAERQLASNGALSGCVLRVSSDNGVLRVTGTIQHELQRDAARNALRAVRSAREVHVNLTKL